MELSIEAFSRIQLAIGICMAIALLVLVCCILYTQNGKHASENLKDAEHLCKASILALALGIMSIIISSEAVCHLPHETTTSSSVSSNADTSSNTPTSASTID